MSCMQECVKLAARGPHKDPGGICALSISSDLIFVASTSGSLLVYRCVSRQGVLQPLQVGSGSTKCAQVMLLQLGVCTTRLQLDIVQSSP